MSNEMLASEIDALRADRDRYKAHSVKLNSLCWKLHVALGDVDPDRDDKIDSPDDPRDLVDRLVAEAEERGEQKYAALVDVVSRYLADVAEFDPDPFEIEMGAALLALREDEK